MADAPHVVYPQLDNLVYAHNFAQAHASTKEAEAHHEYVADTLPNRGRRCG
jgi:hypothetical protein